ncbi:unnamed protein product, partial [Didymodactylos carnosus]
DDPNELPAFVCSNEAAKSYRYSIKGDNLFAAVLLYAKQKLKSDSLSSSNQTALKNLIINLEKVAQTNKFSLDETSDKIKNRQKKTCCTLINNIGMYVPVKNDIGYRPVPLNKDQFKKLCENLCNGKNIKIKQTSEDELQNIITCIQFANDELDYGEGLELGINLFLYGSNILHSQIITLLPIAYQLLKRNLYSKIITDHIARRSNSIEDINYFKKHRNND